MNQVNITLSNISSLLCPGPETHHRPLRGPQRWTQPHLPAGGALWRDTGELNWPLTLRYRDFRFCHNPPVLSSPVLFSLLSCLTDFYLLSYLLYCLFIVTWTVLNVYPSQILFWWASCLHSCMCWIWFSRDLWTFQYMLRLCALFYFTYLSTSLLGTHLLVMSP